ncbi:N-acetylmuramoyl-L-alanine amidase [Granulicella cerasi]|uniref:N-acetylmuramoyl-L-alanine amidase n=1 Tax=Granulicella cerasi TaxID=741063 RepID=A0ABW1ZC21_9BACT|nr:N-acetylmuramoyl-L-alanine amidase [Granulicella cerasi]
MVGLRHRRFVGALLCACALCVRAQSGAWDAALQARQSFEAQPHHSKAEYRRVMDNFRAIYHANPADVHSSRAVQQVAELLAEQGRELQDGKSLNDAMGQYEFLRQQYPRSLAARETATVTLDQLKDGSAPKFAAGSDSADAASADGPAAGDDHYHRPVHAEAASAATMPAESLDAKSAKATPREPQSEPVAEAAPSDSKKPMALVSGIRHWSTPSYTRVVIDLGDEVTYEAARVEHPDRIYFDLHHAKLAHELVGKSFNVVDDGFLTKMRAAQFSNDVTRVVLDVHEVSEYSAFLLPNPYRLIIDIHGKGESAPAGDAVVPTEKPEASLAKPVPREPVVEAPRAKSTETSSLPPMAVTDGGDSFGLPSRTAPATTSKVAAPRVVIPQKATAARPVPNAVVSSVSSTTPDVAAVSSQPGRVNATHKPTSAPISSKTARDVADVAPSPKPSKHVAGEPAQVAPPTAAGETSLMRALGLKIGRIVIDAGHGGHDSGTLGADGIQEKDVVLDVALRLGKLCHERLGAEIVYTRADDTFIPLETRTAIANKAQADLFISVHANSSSDPTARGVEVYYLNFTSDPDAMRVAGRENAVSTQSVHELSDLVKKIALKDKIEESRELASDVDDSLYAGLERNNGALKNRGVKKAPFVVLIGANMPSILAEISFVTNPRDAAQLRTPEYRQRVAESLFGGVRRYAEGINGASSKRKMATQRAAVGHSSNDDN